MKLIKYVETVEVLTNSTTKTKFYFGEQPILRNKRILYVDAWLVGNVSESPSDLLVINNTVFYKSFLVLVSKGKEIINRIPLYHLTYNFQKYEKYILDLVIDFPKSYIEIGSIASLSATETFIFTFYYNDQVKEVPEYRGINVESIEVKTTPVTLRKFYFPDHENLRGKRIQFLEYVQDNFVSMTPGGDNIVNNTVRKKTYLTLAERGQEKIRKIPLYSLMAYYYNGFKIPLDNIEIDFPNSYFEVPDTADTVADEKFFLNVYFYDRILGKK